MKYSDFERECAVLKTPEEMPPHPFVSDDQMNREADAIMNALTKQRMSAMREHPCSCGRRVIMAADLMFCPFCGKRYEKE